jgi:sterol desaturase/sphingolipid hydroxylase (fatty acid hydroxylase superfamily)
MASLRTASPGVLKKRIDVSTDAPKAAADEAASSKEGDYEFKEPDGPLTLSHHFSSLLMSGDWINTLVEFILLATLTTAAVCMPPEKVNVAGSMTLFEVALFYWATSLVTRVYNSYLEACYFAFPAYRTQPPHEHALKGRRDLCGRDITQLKQLVLHDRLTLFSQFVFGVAIYYLFPGYYPAKENVSDSFLVRIGKLALNHYVMSFGMYWGHRAYHVNPWLWKNLHSVHHWAKHPLSRNTYQDHWMENLINHIAGHFSAQLLVPLDHGTFWFSHVFRILESLEKHSGISCYLNLAHQTQRWLPFAQMPHHHDWHHEGHKTCNYTFSALGGVWDCVFGTRKHGRADQFSTTPGRAGQETAFDRKLMASKTPARKGIFDNAAAVCMPSCMFLLAVTCRVGMFGCSVGLPLWKLLL